MPTVATISTGSRRPASATVAAFAAAGPVAPTQTSVVTPLSAARESTASRSASNSGSATWQCESTSASVIAPPPTPGGSSLRDHLDARKERLGREGPMAGLEPVAPGQLEVRQTLGRETEHRPEADRRLGKERLEQLRGHPERLAELVQDCPHAWPPRRILGERERCRLGHVLVGMVERPPDRLEGAVEAELRDLRVGLAPGDGE